jgi:hypothetical protein
LPDQKVDPNTMTRASFRREVTKSGFTGALIYKLRRKKPLEYNDKPDEDNASTEDTSTSFQFLVIWGLNDEYEYSIRALLIKHSNAITWNEDTLEKLHSMYLALLRDGLLREATWLLDDKTMLMTTSEWKVGQTTEITISEGTRKDGAIEPLWVPSSM